MPQRTSGITQVLNRAAAGDVEAAERLWSLVTTSYGASPAASFARNCPARPSRRRAWSTRRTSSSQRPRAFRFKAANTSTPWRAEQCDRSWSIGRDAETPKNALPVGMS